MMKIAMANDHAGTSMKYEIKAYLESQGHTVVDFGAYDEESCDLSDFVLKAALAVAKGECDRGIFVDGVGYGSAMIANKVNGIYACVCQDPFCAQLAREHNDANVLCLGAKIIGGMIGGLGGACEIMSNYINYSWVELTGFGWDGVTIAIFAKNNPRNVPLAAIFIAYLRTGAMVMSYKTNIQSDLTSVIEGVVILFLLAEKFLSKTYRRMIVKETEERKLAELALAEKEGK